MRSVAILNKREHGSVPCTVRDMVLQFGLTRVEPECDGDNDI